MKQNILSFFILLCISNNLLLADRKFNVVNKCQQTIWMGVQQGSANTNPLPMDGGFEVGQGETKSISVPDDWESARLWPRTGCKDENGKFQCKTGNCGAELNGFKMECKGIGGENPSTLAEFTLHNAQHPQPDTYDMSNVDGHNIGMSIKPIENTYEKVNNPDLNKYNCGTVTCNFDMSQCPPELIMDDENGGKVCLSICAAIHNEQQRKQHGHLNDIFNDEEKRSLVCCSSDKGYDHSPHNKENQPQGTKFCEVENWPRSTNDKRYDQIFKEQCSDVYSWQFDDLKSTYQCKNADYEITLCPDGGNVLYAENNSTISEIKHTTRKLIDYLAKSAKPTSPDPSVTTEETLVDDSTTQNQCHAYCMANLDFYQKQKQTSTPIDLTTAPASNETDQVVLHAESDNGWERVFEDEFNGNGAVDSDKWEFEVGIGPGNDGWGNDELQYYTNNRLENAHCEDGHLSIEARKEEFEGRQYTSTRLKSKQAFLYGRLQIRAKLPAGKGTWSALWMLPVTTTYTSQYWPDNGEIDLMEQVGYEPAKIHSAIHTKANNHMINTQQTAAIDINDATTEYKIYTLHWNPDTIEMFVGDDVTTALDKSIFKYEKGDKDWTQWPFDKEFRILMNVAVGGKWGGAQGIDDNAFPQRMEIDWVHFDKK